MVVTFYIEIAHICIVIYNNTDGSRLLSKSRVCTSWVTMFYFVLQGVVLCESPNRLANSVYGALMVHILTLFPHLQSASPTTLILLLCTI